MVAERATMVRYTYIACIAIIMQVILLTAYRLNYVYSNNFMQCFMLAEWTFEIERPIQPTRTSIVTTNNPPTDPPSPMTTRQEQNDTTTSADMSKHASQWH